MLHPIDLLVIVAYLGLTLGIGLLFARRNRTSDHYFLGGRNFPGWAIGLSFLGSTISSVTFIAYPADSFKTAWLRLVPNLAFPVIVLMAAFLFVPFFRRGTIHSAYHYLSLRFGPHVSVYAASVYLCMQMVRAATVTYLLAVLVATLTGLPVSWGIVLAAGLTAFYTVKGGFEAVVWTDVIQVIVLLSGAMACILFIAHAVPGGLFAIVTEAFAAGKISFRDLAPGSPGLVDVPAGFSLTEKTSTMLLLVGAANYIAGQLDQDSVQRWCAARSGVEARRSMLWLGVGALPVWVGFMFLGSCLWVYHQHFPSEVSQAILAGTRKAEDVLPQFILSVLPTGLAGLVISAALAAAMASLSSCINASGMVWLNDIYRPHLAPGRTDAHYLRMSRITSLVVALLMVGGALVFDAVSTKTLMEFVLVVTALFGGGISGMFLFGMLTRWGDAKAVLVGIGATVAFTIYAMLVGFGFLPRIFDAYYTSIMCNMVMFATCCLAAWLRPRPGVALAGLTLWDPPDVASPAPRAAPSHPLS